MRFGPDKVHDLARQILQMLREDPGVEFLAGEDAVRVAIGSAILDDLEEEDEIEREVDELLRQHADAIDREDMDVSALRQRFKGEIARKRGFII
jgi:hypothetical protein